jgi:N-acetylglucosamine transport system substrate-binding protein
MGSFASYKSVAGLGTVSEIFFEPVNSLVAGTLTEDEWVASIIAANDLMRANLVQ